MALTAEQQKAIDAVLTDPMVRTAVKVALDAEKQSKVLDASGVQRKDVGLVPALPTGATVETVVTPAVAEQMKHTTISLDGLTADSAALIKARIDEIVKAGSGGKCPTCGKAMEGGKCAEHGAPDGEQAKKSIGEAQPAEVAEPVLPKPTPPTGMEQKKGLQPQGVAMKQLGQTRPLLTSDIGDMYEAITEIIEQRVAKAVADTTTKIYAEVSKALQERDQYLGDHAKKFEELEILKEAVLVQKAYDEMVNVVNQHSEHLAEVQLSQEKIETMSKQLIDSNVTPRISTLFKSLAASESLATVIKDDHPLAMAHPAESASDSFAKYGLKPSRSNGNG